MQWSKTLISEYDIGTWQPQSYHLNGQLFWHSPGSYKSGDIGDRIICFNTNENRLYGIDLPVHHPKLTFKSQAYYMGLTTCFMVGDFWRTFKIWFYNEKSTMSCPWDLHYTETPIISDSQYLGFSNQRFLFAAYVLMRHNRKYRYSRRMYYLDGAGNVSVKLITPFMKHDFGIDNFVEFVETLTKF